MTSLYPCFVIVLYPGPDRPGTIFEALSDNHAVALNILTYKEWLQQDYIPEQPIIRLFEDGSWRFMEERTEKSMLRKELTAMLKKRNRIAA